MAEEGYERKRVQTRIIVGDLALTVSPAHTPRKAKYKTELRTDGQTNVRTYRAQECPVR